MRFLTSVLGRYLIYRTLQGVGVIAAGVLATIVLIDVVEQVRGAGVRSELTVLGAFELTAYRAPMLLEQTLPFIVLAGVMLTLNGLNRRNELVALRASGVSAWRFIGPPTALAAALGLVSTMALNPLGAMLNHRYEQRVAELNGAARPEAEPIWLRQGDEAGQVVIRASAVAPEAGRIADAVFYFFEFTPEGALVFVRRVAAAEAELRDGFWQLHGVIEGEPGGAGVKAPYLAIPTSLEPEALMERFASASTLSFWQLPQVIENARAAGLTPVRYETRWHALLAAPVMLAAMAALGAIFSLRLQRLGGAAAWTAGGVAAGFGMFFFSSFATAFAIAEIVPPVVAAWAAPLAGLLAAMAALGFLEDG